MKTGDYEWCWVCDGEGRVNGVKCKACHGLGAVEVKVSEEQRLKDIAEAAKLQATLNKRKDTQ